MKKNNEVQICSVVVIGLGIMLGLTILCYVLPWLEKGGPNETFTLSVFITLTIVLALSVGLFLWGIITMSPTVVIDEKGLHKSLFRKFFKREILWEEMKQIRFYRNPTVGMWIVFSKSDIIGKSLSKCWRSRDTICIVYSLKLDNLIKEYYGKSIEEAACK